MSSSGGENRKNMSSKPHIAFMERRGRHKSRAISYGSGDSLWGPYIPEPDDLNKMKPFVKGPDPHFLLMQRYRRKQVILTKGYKMTQSPAFDLSRNRNINTKPLDQGRIRNKIDAFDRYIDRYSMHLYKE